MSAKRMLWATSFTITFALLAVVGYRLSAIHMSYNPDESQLTDDASVKTYLDSYFDSTEGGPKRPLYVPTGIFISTLDWIDANSFFVSGYIWQKYPLSFPEESMGFTLPEAVKLKKELIHKTKFESFQAIDWYFEGQINQYFDYTTFPLDNKVVNIRMWANDFGQRVILIPDYESYVSTLASDKFGLDPDIYLGGYRISETFYRYNQPVFDTSFGFGKENLRKKFPELSYNVVLKRRAVDALIIHVLPLIAVFLLCFSTLLSNTLDESKRLIYSFSYMQILSSCAGLFFVILLAHIHLREKFAGVGTIYLEYLYILAYFAVTYVTVNAFLVVRSKLSDRLAFRVIKFEDDLLPKVLFLPLFAGITLLLSLVLY